MERVSSDEEAYEEEEDAVDVATDLCVCALKRVLEPRHAPVPLRRYSVYLLYWYKSASGRRNGLLRLRSKACLGAPARACAPAQVLLYQ
jgi:hypothetical protein